MIPLLCPDDSHSPRVCLIISRHRTELFLKQFLAGLYDSLALVRTLDFFLHSAVVRENSLNVRAHTGCHTHTHHTHMHWHTHTHTVPGLERRPAPRQPLRIPQGARAADCDDGPTRLRAAGGKVNEIRYHCNQFLTIIGVCVCVYVHVCVSVHMPDPFVCPLSTSCMTSLTMVSLHSRGRAATQPAPTPRHGRSPGVLPGLPGERLRVCVFV